MVSRLLRGIGSLMGSSLLSVRCSMEGGVGGWGLMIEMKYVDDMKFETSYSKLFCLSS
jgi:hypothetical protein